MDLKWIIPEDDLTNEVLALAKSLNVPPIIAKILWKRGVQDTESAKKFFRPSIARLYDPFIMAGMKEAVDRLRRAVLSDEKVLIYGDYDVDGITSVSRIPVGKSKVWDR